MAAQAAVIKSGLKGRNSCFCAGMKQLKLHAILVNVQQAWKNSGGSSTLKFAYELESQMCTLFPH